MITHSNWKKRIMFLWFDYIDEMISRLIQRQVNGIPQEDALLELNLLVMATGRLREDVMIFNVVL